MRTRLITCLALVTAFLTGVPAPASAATDTTQRVSVATGGAQANSFSFVPSVSADGRYVAFESGASDLVAGDTNDAVDVFVHDRQGGATTRVSVATGGAEANGTSETPSISADGRYVAFRSFAWNLVAGDTNDAEDVFVHDRQGGATTRVSVATGGAQADGQSSMPSISADGRYVAFGSAASNLVVGDTNAAEDVFVHDRQGGATARVSLATGGAQANNGSFGPSVSSDGRHVAFGSAASNLVAGDTNATQDVFVRDRLTGATARVSLATGGAQANNGSFDPSISADGRHVAFTSFASNLVAGDTNAKDDVFVRDRLTGATQRVSVATSGAQANNGSFGPSVSADGRHVAFFSFASNLVVGDTNATYDVFVRDRLTGATQRVSLTSGGAQANEFSGGPSVSADGRHVAFDSFASNLVASDTNAALDVFVRSIAPVDTTAPAVAITGKPAVLTASATATFSFAGTDGTDPVGSLRYLCSRDGAAASACTSPATYTALTSGVHTFTVKVIDPSGNSSTATYSWRVDRVAPTLSMTGPGTGYALTTSLVPAWAAKDVGGGLANVDVRWVRAPYNGGFGAAVYPRTWQKTTDTKATLAGVTPGYTYCFSARARDRAGNLSGWSAPRCSAVALDDRSLVASTGWTRATGSLFYRGTATVTSRPALTLTRTGVKTRRIYLVATRCPTCGTVGVYWNRTLIRKVSLYAKATTRRSVLGITTFTGVRSGTLTIRTLTRNKAVQIDGVALLRG